jgi:hypothetical protein
MCQTENNGLVETLDPENAKVELIHSSLDSPDSAHDQMQAKTFAYTSEQFLFCFEFP